MNISLSSLCSSLLVIVNIKRRLIARTLISRGMVDPPTGYRLLEIASVLLCRIPGSAFKNSNLAIGAV